MQKYLGRTYAFLFRDRQRYGETKYGTFERENTSNFRHVGPISSVVGRKHAFCQKKNVPLKYFEKIQFFR